jgi:hypothetical protein
MSSSHPTLSSAVENRGIYYGLPTYSPSVKGLKALVFGANGISGNYMLRVLSQAPKRWEHVAAVSRRPQMASSQGIGHNVAHIQIDLLQNPKEIAKILKYHQVQA